jgi:L-threonylcarbamoyladenylate synthase
MLKSHYAPNKKVVIGNIPELIKQYDIKDCVILSFRENYLTIDSNKQVILSSSGDLNKAAQNLFAALRHLDTLPAKYILTEFVPDHGLGRAINDRLKRAAAK